MSSENEKWSYEKENEQEKLIDEEIESRKSVRRMK